MHDETSYRDLVLRANNKRKLTNVWSYCNASLGNSLFDNILSKQIFEIFIIKQCQYWS
jgi:hypothetical protein